MKTTSLAMTLFLVMASTLLADNSSVRPAYCAGRWYPGDKNQLSAQVTKWIQDAPPLSEKEKPLAIIGPHAGYTYSGPTLGSAYSNLPGHNYNRVIVLAFSHRNAGRYEGIDVPKSLKAYSTPLGEIPIDRAACDQLLKNKLFTSHEKIDQGEHSLELQIPFLQSTIKDFKLIPLLIGQLNEDQTVKAAKALLPLLDENTLIVASTDFTHYGPNYGYTPFDKDIRTNLTKLADEAAAAIENDDYDAFLEHIEKTQDTICGRGPVKLLLKTLAMDGGAKGIRTRLAFSGEQAGDWTNSVTYQGFVFIPRPYTLTRAERDILLKTVRQSLEMNLLNKPAPDEDPVKLTNKLNADGACFVTLMNHGDLRGCIGTMVAREPLIQSVINNTYNALHDPRFTSNPITKKELPDLDYEISYLTPMKKINNFDDIVIGRDGLYIILNGRRGVLLPQVAYERGWTRQKFLEQVCWKAGLPKDAWKDKNAQIYTFTAEVFGQSMKADEKTAK